MSHKKTNEESVLLDVSVRPENGEKVVLFHFSDQTFHSIRVKKGMAKRDVGYTLKLTGGHM